MTRSESCAIRSALRSAVTLAALALLLVAASGCRDSGVEDPWVEAQRGRHDDNGYGPCGPSRGLEEHYKHFLYWTSDGAHLVFDVDDTIWTLDIEDARLRGVADVSRSHEGDRASSVRRGFAPAPMYGFYADVSPDGTRIVYSTCEYGLDNASGEYYEIAKVNVDGTGRRRLTEGERFEGYPTWSPDGTQIVFITNTSRSSPEYYASSGWVSRDDIKLTTLPAEPLLGQSKAAMKVRLGTTRIALSPLIWSPDGQRVAYIANEGEGYTSPRRVLYTTGMDLTKPAATSDASRGREPTAPPSWSPDGEELAFAAVGGGEAVLYAVRPDGTGLREVWRSGTEGASTPIVQVSWSPDGSEILFVSDGVYVVGADGSDARLLSPDLPGVIFGLDQRDGPPDVGGVRAAWSPDGSRVAVHYPQRQAYTGSTRPLLVTISANGTDLRTLAGGHEDDSSLRILNAPQPDSPVDLTACSGGMVVPAPEENPGLVHDCEVLLSIRDRLVGDSKLRWNERTRIDDWRGVAVAAQPPRVRALSLGQNGLTGTLPPELGRLAELRTLNLAENYLSGSIPPELGGLTNLNYLDLSTNFLTGPLPAELGGLANLETLLLGGNMLTGCVPVELPEIWVEASRLERCAG